MMHMIQYYISDWAISILYIQANVKIWALELNKYYSSDMHKFNGWEENGKLLV